MVTVGVNAGSLVAIRNQAHAGAKNKDAPLAEENFGDARMLSFGVSGQTEQNPEPPTVQAGSGERHRFGVPGWLSH